MATHLRVADESMRDVPTDGETMGEVMMRGNNVMAGYFQDPEATAEITRVEPATRVDGCAQHIEVVHVDLNGTHTVPAAGVWNRWPGIVDFDPAMWVVHSG